MLPILSTNTFWKNKFIKSIPSSFQSLSHFLSNWKSQVARMVDLHYLLEERIVDYSYVHLIP